MIIGLGLGAVANFIMWISFHRHSYSGGVSLSPRIEAEELLFLPSSRHLAGVPSIRTVALPNRQFRIINGGRPNFGGLDLDFTLRRRIIKDETTKEDHVGGTYTTGPAELTETKTKNGNVTQSPLLNCKSCRVHQLPFGCVELTPVELQATPCMSWDSSIPVSKG